MIIYGKEAEVLKAQRRSLAAWINNTLGATLVNSENLIRKLSTGVILCKLAQRIQDKVNYSKGNYENKDLKYWESAKKKTFFARDNAQQFIQWCKSFGVRDAILFESDGLVLHTQPRTVLLCLLEVSRLAAKYGVLLPPPLQLPEDATITVREDDVASEGSEDEYFLTAKRYHPWDSGCSSGPRSPSPVSIYSKASSPYSSLKKSGIPLLKKRDNQLLGRDISRNVVLINPTTDDYESRNCRVSQKNSTLPRASSPTMRQSSSSAKTVSISGRLKNNSNLNKSCCSLTSTQKSNDFSSKTPAIPSLQRSRSSLDERVYSIARKYQKDETRICRLSEGHYDINGKILYLRIVRGSTVVVRVGGGWDTLEHFLSSRKFNRPSEPKWSRTARCIQKPDQRIASNKYLYKTV